MRSSVFTAACVIVVAMLSFTVLSAQVEQEKREFTLDWGRYFQPQSIPLLSTYIEQTATDKSGNTYLFGIRLNSDTVCFISEGDSILCTDGYFFVIKLDGDGSFLWSRSFGGKRGHIRRPVFDKDGNLFFNAIVRDTNIIDGVPYIGSEDPNALSIFTIQMTPDGTFQSVRQLGDSLGFNPAQIVPTHNGDLLVAGLLQHPVTLDGTLYKPVNDFDGLLLRLDPEGKPRWVRQFSGSDNVSVTGVTEAPNGDCYATAVFYDSLFLESTTHTLLNPDSESYINYDLAVLKLDAGGTLRESTQAGSDGFEGVVGLTVTPNNEVAMAVRVQGNGQYGERMFQASDPRQQSIIIARFSLDLQELSTLHLRSPEDFDAFPDHFLVHPDGTMILAGKFTQELHVNDDTLVAPDRDHQWHSVRNNPKAFVISMHPDSSSIQYFHMQNGKNVSIQGLGSDSLGNLYSTSSFHDSLIVLDKVQERVETSLTQYYVLKLSPPLPPSSVPEQIEVRGREQECENSIRRVSGPATDEAHFTLVRSGAVTVTLYDILGNRVAVIADGHFSAGDHTLPLQPTGYPSGRYLLVLKTEDCTQATPVEIIR